MDAATQDYISFLIDLELQGGRKLLAGKDGVGQNHDVYDDPPSNAPPYNATPHCIYLYHVTFDAEHRPITRHFFYPGGNPDADLSATQPIADGDVQMILTRIGQDIRSGGAVAHEITNENNFQDIKWKRISYVAFLIDDEHWRFVKRLDPQGKPTNLSAVVFNVSKQSTPNHSFYRARDVRVNIAQTGENPVNRTAFYMVDYVTDATGSPLGHALPPPQKEAEPYVFDMYFTVPFSSQANGETMICVFDPTGTNLGPPLTPP